MYSALFLGNHSRVKIFSLFANAKRLLETKSSPNNIHVFDGLKVISLAWIIGGHGYSVWNEIVPSQNIEDLYEVNRLSWFTKCMTNYHRMIK